MEGEEPSDLEVSAHTPRPLAEGVIDDHQATGSDGAPGVQLHADDLQVELAVLEAREAEEVRRTEGEGVPDVVVDLDQAQPDWESVTPEVALGAEDLETVVSKDPKARTDEDEEGDEEIIVEIDED